MMLANAGCGRTAVISRIAQWLVGRLEWHRVAGWPVSSLAGFAGTTAVLFRQDQYGHVVCGGVLGG